jgi:hypothetical protein
VLVATTHRLVNAVAVLLLTSEGDLSVEVVCADVEPRRHPTALIPSSIPSLSRRQ